AGANGRGGADGRGDGKGDGVGRGERREEDESVTFHASDLLLDGDDVLMDRAWTERRTALETLFRRRRVKRTALQQIDGDPDKVLRRASRDGWPGILARRADSAYEPGSRSDALRRVAIR
ncbi:MAG TPA: hypothetical protein VHG09_09820, partial [Longimicrobiales bacterium]|nr:hypothetical protein [Longimicrobiales bacterium]